MPQKLWVVPLRATRNERNALREPCARLQMPTDTLSHPGNHHACPLSAVTPWPRSWTTIRQCESHPGQSRRGTYGHGRLHSSHSQHCHRHRIRLSTTTQHHSDRCEAREHVNSTPPLHFHEPTYPPSHSHASRRSVALGRLDMRRETHYRVKDGRAGRTGAILTVTCVERPAASAHLRDSHGGQDQKGSSPARKAAERKAEERP